MASLWIEGKAPGDARKLVGNATPMKAIMALKAEVVARKARGWTATYAPDALAVILTKPDRAVRLLYVEPNSPPTNDLEPGQPRQVDGKGVVMLKGGTIHPIGASPTP